MTVRMAGIIHPSRRPRVLVVGGDPRQRGHREQFEKLAVQWDFDGEWLMANYDSPQRLVHTIHGRMKSGLDVLTLLHWNKHVVTKAGLKLAPVRSATPMTLAVRPTGIFLRMGMSSVRTIAPRRASESRPHARATSTQVPALLPRPTRPRS